MNHTGTVRIETPRLILRRFVIEDAPAAFRNWTSDPEVTKFLTWPTHPALSVTEAVLSDWTASYEKPDTYQWAIELKELGEPIGGISVVEMDERIGKVHIGYCIGKNWWGQGVMTEAFSAIISYLFETVGANRIEARHDSNNPASGAVMRKCGMQYEGTLRQADWNNQGIVDVAWYGILRKEYEERKK